MNILYITAMLGVKYSGLTSAVPKHIESQSIYDNVFWYNMLELTTQIENCSVPCHTIKEFPDLDIMKLPKPFNKPDLVIYEDFYYLQFLKIAKQIKKLSIPYVIVPHCCLCKQAQNSKGLKKRIANILLFNRFAHDASAIHYLTDREYKDSGARWNRNHFILPNGADLPDEELQRKPHEGIIGSFIGRLDIDHKGLDLLAEAIYVDRQLLRDKNCIINVYGADSEGDKERLIELIDSKGISDIMKVNPPVYDKEKENVLLNTDFFVLTSRYEGHPMGLIEALAYGIPSLITYGTNMGEEVERNDTGWVCQSEVDSIALTLLKAINEKHLYNLKGSNGIKLAKQYRWSAIAENAHKHYAQITGKE